MINATSPFNANQQKQKTLITRIGTGIYTFWMKLIGMRIFPLFFNEAN
jgi:hypothetical protein